MKNQNLEKAAYPTLTPELRVSIYYLTPEEGGRTSFLLSGYRGQFYYNNRSWDASQTFIDKEVVFPGETVDCYLTTYSLQWHMGRFYPEKHLK